MRRCLFSLLSVTLLVSLFGCSSGGSCHWAGVCDCQIGTDWCCYPPYQGNIKPVVPVGAIVPVGPGGPIVPVPISNGPVPVAPMPAKVMPDVPSKEPPVKQIPGKQLPPIQ